MKIETKFWASNRYFCWFIMHFAVTFITLTVLLQYEWSSNLPKIMFAGRGVALSRQWHCSKRTSWHKEEEAQQCFEGKGETEVSDRRRSGLHVHRTWPWDRRGIHKDSHGARHRKEQAAVAWNKCRQMKVGTLALSRSGIMISVTSLRRTDDRTVQVWYISHQLLHDTKR